jgi:transcriptional regulator with XRE-family HTH domain
MFLEEKKQSSEYNSNCPCAKGWTQQELADRMGCQVQTINKIENARYSPNCDILYSLLECLDLTLKINKKL